MGADMAFVLWLLMALVPFFIGKGALCILYGNQPTQELSPADSVLTGGMIIIGLAEAAHLAGCILGRSFSGCVMLFGAGVGVCLAAAAFILFPERKRQKADLQLQRKASREQVKRALTVRNTGAQQFVWVVFGVIAVVQLVTVVTAQEVYLDGDMTRETVSSFLSSDVIYQVNPMTGQPYTAGIPLRLKILCMPFFYGSLCKGFGLGVDTVVLSVVPAFVLLGSYLAYSTVAKRLFPEDGSKRAAFMVAVALLYSVGDYMYGMDGFDILHSGFRPVAIRAAILLPYTFGLMLRKKYKLVVLCILAEACMVWTLYGMGACVAVTAGMLVLKLVCEWWTKRKGRKGACL